MRVPIARNRLPFWQFVTKLSNRATFDALAFLVIKCFGHLSIGPILGDKDPWREGNIHETLIRCPMSSLSCVSVFPRATEHIFWPRNHYFQLTDPWDMRKKRIFFKILFFSTFYRYFYFFPLIFIPDSKPRFKRPLVDVRLLDLSGIGIYCLKTCLFFDAFCPQRFF